MELLKKIIFVIFVIPFAAMPTGWLIALLGNCNALEQADTCHGFRGALSGIGTGLLLGGIFYCIPTAIACIIILFILDKLTSKKIS
ncbi:MAG TPA: hypothetical protein VGN56_01590 [Candidatus Paceibacterota bacterium]|jgi:hypothetical protein|nr:hypothetical protein [Candidatus Paceibacterota bacterium]